MPRPQQASGRSTPGKREKSAQETRHETQTQSERSKKTKEIKKDEPEKRASAKGQVLPRAARLEQLPVKRLYLVEVLELVAQLSGKLG